MCCCDDVCISLIQGFIELFRHAETAKVVSGDADENEIISFCREEITPLEVSPTLFCNEMNSLHTITDHPGGTWRYHGINLIEK